MQAFKVVRYFGSPSSLHNESTANFLSGVRHFGVFIVLTDFEYALYRVRDLAYIYHKTALYEVEAEPFKKQPTRLPGIAAPSQYLRRWKELVLDGKLEEAEQLFQGELQLYTYEPTNELLACEVTLLRPLIICETSVARFEKPRVATVLAPEILEAMDGIFYDWKVHVHGRDKVSVQSCSGREN
jgi:hypothetical protein